MYRLMRNIHLGLGLISVLMALVFAVSSIVIVYRPLLNTKPTETETAVTLPADARSAPRAAALALMTGHGLRGDLRDIQEKDGRVTFHIVRPGEVSDVAYAVSSGDATIKTKRQSALETLVSLHTNHGFWHEYMPSNLWAALALFASLGLLLLGLSGIYLWFQHHKERVIGGVLLGFSLIFGFTALLLTRLQQ
ncbi:MAG: PepSY domain-containing protein [Bryobacteraceae bacterium]